MYLELVARLHEVFDRFLGSPMARSNSSARTCSTSASTSSVAFGRLVAFLGLDFLVSLRLCETADVRAVMALSPGERGREIATEERGRVTKRAQGGRPTGEETRKVGMKGGRESRKRVTEAGRQLSAESYG